MDLELRGAESTQKSCAPLGLHVLPIFFFFQGVVENVGCGIRSGSNAMAGGCEGLGLPKLCSIVMREKRV